MKSLVLTHGRDNPFGIPDQMKKQFEDAVRWGLERAGAPYHKEIKIEFAFYGDLWRHDRAGNRNAFGDERGGEQEQDQVTDMHVGLAEDILQARGIDLPPSEAERLVWDNLTKVVGWLESKLPSPILDSILRLFLTDVNDYFTNPDARKLTMERIAAEIPNNPDGSILIAHSMGTIVGYDLLMQGTQRNVDGFITYGSPLGFRTVRRNLSDQFGETPFPSGLSRWINIYNREDFIASVNHLKNYYPSNDGKRVEDLDVGEGRTPGFMNLNAGHDLEVYLSSISMGRAIHSIVEGTPL